MEPTICTPEIYNGAGVYNTGATGGGGDTPIDWSQFLIYEYALKKSGGNAFNRITTGKFLDLLSNITNSDTDEYDIEIKLQLNGSLSGDGIFMGSGGGLPSNFEIHATSGQLSLQKMCSSSSYPYCILSVSSGIDLVINILNSKVVYNGNNYSWNRNWNQLKKECSHIDYPYCGYWDENGSRFYYVAIKKDNIILSKIVFAKNLNTNKLGFLDSVNGDFFPLGDSNNNFGPPE